MSPEALLVVLGIALLRAVDVSLGTVRISMVVQSRRGLASLIGFVESMIFVLAAAIVFSGLEDPIRMVSYSFGFALGQFVGLTLNDRLRVGSATVRIFSPAGPVGVADALRAGGFPVTVFDGEGHHGPVRMIHAVLPKRQVPGFMDVCRPWLDRCFVTVGDVPVTSSAANSPSLFPIRPGSRFRNWYGRATEHLGPLRARPLASVIRRRI